MPPKNEAGNGTQNDTRTNNPKAQHDLSISSLKQKFTALFVAPKQQRADTFTDKAVSLGLIDEITPDELRALSNRHFTRQKDYGNQNPSELPILEMARSVSSEVMSNIADAERLKALDPNIKRIENIVVSSIMSPNDMQDVDPDIIVELNDITDSQRRDIGTLLKNYYCGVYELRKRMTNWTAEAQFRSGAGVTIILPEATLSELIDTYDPDRDIVNSAQIPANESLDSCLENDIHLDAIWDTVFTDKFYERVLRHNPYKSVDEQHRDCKSVSMAGKESIAVNAPRVSDGATPVTDKPDKIDSKLQAFIRGLIDDTFDDKNITPDKNELNAVTTGLEGIALTFKKELGKDPTEQNYVRIIDDPEALRIGNLIEKRKKKKLHDIFEKSVLGKLLAKDLDRETALNGKMNRINNLPILDITSHTTNYKEQYAFPFVIDVPTEAVIPICVPGNKKEKLGYFVLVDEYGKFIEASGYMVANNANPSSNRLSVTYMAMYGEMPTESGIYSASGMGTGNGTFVNKAGMTDENMSKVFNYILDEMLKKKLEDMGITDMTIGKYTSIAQCMLYRLLAKKTTSLVFVPEKYVSYVAFDFHADGTGKSKIEDVIYMESLKIPFLTANILATMKNAVPIKKVKLTLDPKQKNTMQTIMMIRDAIIRREKLTPTTWPATVTSQIVAQNLSIETTHPNSEGFSYTVEDTHHEIPKADTDFLEEINNSIITGLGVMPSALSESSEVQFAQSLATTNLHYARSIRKDQVILEDYATRYVKNHLTLSSALVYKIALILANENDNDGASNDTKVNIKKPKGNHDPAMIKPSSADDGTAVSIMAKRISTDTYMKVLKVIDSIRVKLTPPDIAPDNAQYTILTETIKRINEYVDSIYPDDIVSFGNDQDLSNSLRIFKSTVKATMIREAASMIGFKGLISNVPEIDEFMLDKTGVMLRTFEYFKGLDESIKRTVSAMTKKSPEDAESSNDSSDAMW